MKIRTRSLTWNMHHGDSLDPLSKIKYERRASIGGSLKCQQIGRSSRLHNYSAGGWPDGHMRQSEVSGSAGVYSFLEKEGHRGIELGSFTT